MKTSLCTRKQDLIPACLCLCAASCLLKMRNHCSLDLVWRMINICVNSLIATCTLQLMHEHCLTQILEKPMIIHKYSHHQRELKWSYSDNNSSLYYLHFLPYIFHWMHWAVIPGVRSVCPSHSTKMKCLHRFPHLQLQGSAPFCLLLLPEGERHQVVWYASHCWAVRCTFCLFSFPVFWCSSPVLVQLSSHPHLREANLWCLVATLAKITI